ncbi:MAG: YfiR/HmsC family protein [Gammaproteobacteria bacterium]|mgnify:FL=1|nr:YfiR/HmsC family protein [Gammaproteobacteria bacterium]
MPSNFIHQLRILLLIACCSFGLTSAVAQAQGQATTPISAEEMRAAYLANVVHYVTWPNESVRESLTIGVLGSPKVYQELRNSPLGSIRGLRIEVVEVTRPSGGSEVDVLYIGTGASHLLNSSFNAVRGRAILVITEHSPVRDDMMINLVVTTQNRLGFQVNSDRIESTGLRASGDLLMLRGNELEMAVMARRAQARAADLQQQVNGLTSELEQSRAENRQLLNRIDLLEQTVRERDNVLRAQQGTLEDKQQVMDSQQTALQELLRELDGQRQLLFEREEQLRQIQITLRRSEQALEEQQVQLRQKEFQLRQKQQESDELAERILANRNVLAVQQQQLRDQRTALDEQLALLESRERTIDRQRLYLWAIGFAFLIALVMAVTTVVMFLNKRKTAGKLLLTLDELRDAQDKLVESEKMAALGNLVAGVAHEVNTPLGVAITGTSMVHDRLAILKEQLEQGQLTRDQLSGFIERSTDSLSLTQKNLSRVGELISNFKQIAVDQMVAEKREINLKTYLEEVMSTLSIELRRAGIVYKVEMADDIVMTTIPGAMAQIITNLVTNAIRHAFHQRSADEPAILTLSAETAAGNQVRLRFSDNGVGMDEIILGQIYDPFFTTKRSEGGTGLGMPIVYNLVRQKLKGDISVESTVGVGTTFTLMLPRKL